MPEAWAFTNRAARSVAERYEMRSGNPRMNGLLAAAALMLAGSSAAAAMPSLKTAHRDGHRPTPARRDTAMQREIAEHNAAVEARKAEKRAKKRRA